MDFNLQPVIDTAQKAVDIKKIEVEGKTYSDKKLVEVRPDRLRPVRDILKLATLTSLVDYLKQNPDQIGFKNCLLQIESPTRVSLQEILDGEYADAQFRPTLVAVEQSDLVAPEGILRDFGFNQYVDREVFHLALLALFEPSPDRDYLIQLVSNLTASNVTTAKDTGIAQSVTLQKSIIKMEVVEVKPILELQPFRTFREIRQPASRFVFRLQSDGDSVPECALFEADGGEWKLDAMRQIANYLEYRIKPVEGAEAQPLPAILF